MLKSLISKSLSVPHRCEKRYIIVITDNSEYISMGGIIQCYQKMKKELKSYVKS
jgi:hypothetical protein